MDDLILHYIAHCPYEKYDKNIFTPENTNSEYPEIEIICKSHENKVLMTKKVIKIYILNQTLDKEMAFGLIKDAIRAYDDRYRKIKIKI